MTFKDIARMISGIGFTSAYMLFPERTQLPPTYIVFHYPQTRAFSADDGSYKKILTLVIELYTKDKDFAAEAAVESQLDAYGMIYTRQESYLSDDKLFMQEYEMEVLIDE